MKYKEVRSRLKELSRKGKLLSNIRLDKASVILDGEKFVDSHIRMLDKVQEKIDKKEPVNLNTYRPALNRLKKYLSEIAEKQ